VLGVRGRGGHSAVPERGVGHRNLQWSPETV
jgi:hypothetical protein